jgi:hypothetical protein
MADYRLTVRHGSRVERETFPELGAAVDALRERAEEVRTHGPLDTAKAFREYRPEERVAARLEISTGGWLRGRDAGIDVMGDGALVAYAGGMRRTALEADDPFAAVERELR